MESDLKSARFTSVSTYWCGLGGDLWAAEIFQKLPLKTQGRCVCVCKGWNYLISSPRCIATRKSSYSYIPTPTTYPLLLFKTERFTSIVCKRPSLAISNHHHLAKPIKFSHLPFRFPISSLDLELVDVIHGVLCFSYSISSSFDSGLLWNPAIRKYVAIPKSLNDMEKALEIRRSDIVTDHPNPMCGSSFELNAIGFGYSDSKNEFKVIRVWIHSSTSSSITIRHEVFSSRRGLWSDQKETVFKTKDSTGCRFGFITPTGHFYDGIVHWILSMSDQLHSLSMLMFDCERGELITSELPESFNLVERRSAQLIRYSGMLSIILRLSVKVELWVKEGQTTWNILFKAKVNDFHYDDKLCLLTRENQPLNGYVYEESMFLMDQPRALVKSYSKGETVDILTVVNTPRNWIKLSTHAATRGTRHPAGLGVVFTDDHGRFVRAFACKQKRVKSALEVQVKCLWEGVQLATHMQIHNLLVEIDSVLLIQALTTSGFETESSIDRLIQRLRWTLNTNNSFWRVGICYVPAELNIVANWFAKTGKNHDSEFPVIFDDAPYEVEQLLANQPTIKRKRRKSTRKSDFVIQ